MNIGVFRYDESLMEWIFGSSKGSVGLELG